jgi:hypothetical protein
MNVSENKFYSQGTSQKESELIEQNESHSSHNKNLNEGTILTKIHYRNKLYSYLLTTFLIQDNDKFARFERWIIENRTLAKKLELRVINISSNLIFLLHELILKRK